MSFVENTLYRLINGKKTITKPTFIKDFEKENDQLKDLIELSNKVTTSKKEFINRDIAFLKQGLKGEENVYFELSNSFLPILCLHDIRIKFEDYVAQLDFVIISSKFIYVFETKKLSGDIEITKDGDFIRIFKDASGKVLKREGMYSPIVQNERHVNILRQMLVKEGLVKTLPIKSAVIIANPKTIINKYKAPKNIQNNIYKYDQIKNLLEKEFNNKENERNLLEKYIYEIGEFLESNHTPIKINYIDKYSLSEEDFANTNTSNADISIAVEDNKSDNLPILEDSDKLFELLKNYRLRISKQENIKAYMVFTNKELEDLIAFKPKTKEDLSLIKGFGQVKIQKYGEDILNIININL